MINTKYAEIKNLSKNSKTVDFYYSARVMGLNAEEPSLKMPGKHPLYMLHRVKRQTAAVAPPSIPGAVTQQPALVTSGSYSYLQESRKTLSTFLKHDVSR